jgi:hypothetical protein
MKTTLLLALTLTAGSAFAQTPAPAPQPAKPAMQVDARFAAWLGCWRLDDDLAGTGARMCITPEKGGVRLQTLVGTQRGIDEVVIPDAAPHAISDAECKGTERAEWSSDGARMFRTTDVTCGKEAPRTVKTLAFMAAGPSWISVQHVSGAAANTSVRVQRYRRAANQQLADGSKAPQPEASLTIRTTPETTRWSIEDVIEASSKVPAEAVQAALSEVGHGFDVNKRTLVALADGGVKPEVIDLMVALTYPRRFVVERRGGSAPTGILTGNGWFDPMMSPMLMGGMADCFSPIGYGYRSYYSMCGNMGYGYSPFGYDYYGYNRYYGLSGYGGYGGWVDVGALPTGTGILPTAQADGRVINGRGYTQIRDRESESSPRSSGGGGNGSGWSGSGGGVSSGGYSSGSASGGSSGGSSSGGDSGARTAVPKGGGQ